VHGKTRQSTELWDVAVTQFTVYIFTRFVRILLVTDRQTDRQTEGWTDRRAESYAALCIYASRVKHCLTAKRYVSADGSSTGQIYGAATSRMLLKWC